MRAFFVVLSLLLVGCRLEVTSLLDGEVDTVETEDTDVSFKVEFEGDSVTFHHAMLTCVDGVKEGGGLATKSYEGAAFDDEGWAYLTTRPGECPLPHFNVWDNYGGNTNPFVLGELVVYEETDVTEMQDSPSSGMELYLWVYTQGESWEPRTVNWESGGRFWDGDEPLPTPFNSVVGWEYWEPIPTYTE